MEPRRVRSEPRGNPAPESHDLGPGHPPDHHRAGSRRSRAHGRRRRLRQRRAVRDRARLPALGRAAARRALACRRRGGGWLRGRQGRPRDALRRARARAPRRSREDTSCSTQGRRRRRTQGGSASCTRRSSRAPGGRSSSTSRRSSRQFRSASSTRTSSRTRRRSRTSRSPWTRTSRSARSSMLRERQPDSSYARLACSTSIAATRSAPGASRSRSISRSSRPSGRSPRTRRPPLRDRIVAALAERFDGRASLMRRSRSTVGWLKGRMRRVATALRIARRLVRALLGAGGGAVGRRQEPKLVATVRA